MTPQHYMYIAVADQDLELKGGPGLDFLALLAFFVSVMSSSLTQNKGGGSSPIYGELNTFYDIFFFTTCSCRWQTLEAD